MALLSYKRHFIYLKTHRTASTTTECYFEAECLAPGEYETSLLRAADYPAIPEITTSWGAVGARGGYARADPRPSFRNHMSANAVRLRAGEAFWREALKFCNVRNPWDKTVSAFWGDLSDDDAAALATQDFSVIVRTFQAWVDQRWRRASDRDKYLIDGRFCVDIVIRYERLADGIADVCERIGTPFDPERIRRWGAHKRAPVRNPYQHYYSPRLRHLVRDVYAPEIERFGYRFD